METENATVEPQAVPQVTAVCAEFLRELNDEEIQSVIGAIAGALAEWGNVTIYAQQIDAAWTQPAEVSHV